MLPLDDRFGERPDPLMAGRPELIQGVTSLTSGRHHMRLEFTDYGDGLGNDAPWRCSSMGCWMGPLTSTIFR